jgi:hypothetical protein
VIGILVVASALGNASRDDRAVATSPLPTAAAVAAPTRYSPALPALPVTSPTPADVSVDEPVVTPAHRSTAQARPPVATSKPVTRTSAATSKPAPRTVQAAPKPSGCDSNYSGCVPVASDVDCEGGSGNGPAYVAGPVRVVGNDIYDLDRDGDGVACE